MILPIGCGSQTEQIVLSNPDKVDISEDSWSSSFAFKQNDLILNKNLKKQLFKN